MRWVFFIPLSVLMLEMVLHFSSVPNPLSTLPTTLAFALFWGAVLQLPCSLLKNERSAAKLRIAILLLLGFLFSVQFFVFRKFKLFYDPQTIIFGAQDAIGQFGDSVASLILSPSGVAYLFVFFAPALIAIAAFYSQKLRTFMAPAFSGEAAHVAAAAIVMYCGALSLVFSLGNLGTYWAERYNFQDATSSFGLLTSLAKEGESALFGRTRAFGTAQISTGDRRASIPLSTVLQSSEDSRQNLAQASTTESQSAKTAVHSQASEKDAEEITYKPNVMDIDFEALAASAEGSWAQTDHYVASLVPSSQNEYTGLFEGYNLIFISAEALSAEAIRPDTTPMLWRMAEKGIQLEDYYQFDTAGTTGGECANLFGLLATEGGSSVKMTADNNNYLTIGNALNRLGYEGWAFHNNSYQYYDRHLTHVNLGYNKGYMGYGNGMEQWVEWQWPESDLEMVQGTFENVYGNSKLFNVYYMSVSGHSDYAPGTNRMAEKNRDAVEQLSFSEPVKNYLAANVELDRAMEYLVHKLEEKEIDKRTVIVIAADHFPYGLDDDAPIGQLPYVSELYGYEVQNVFQRDHNRAIIWSASLEEHEPIVAQGPCASIDLLPTLLNLFGCEWDSRLLPGRDVLSDASPLVFNLGYDWKSDLGTYWARSGTFEPREGASIPEGYVEATNQSVANKINYCHVVLADDYWRHVFGDSAPMKLE